jgi:hypothetical protein
MRKKEKLVRRFLLWAGHGNPYPMHLLMAPSNPSRRYMIRKLAKCAQQPCIAVQLPPEEVLPYFQEPPGHDEMKDPGRVLGKTLEWADAFHKALFAAFPAMRAKVGDNVEALHEELKKFEQEYREKHGHGAADGQQ